MSTENPNPTPEATPADAAASASAAATPEATPANPPAEAAAAATPEAPAVELPFQAEVQQVLALVINSLYTNQEVFLRELISNASDALDKARFLALTRKDVTEQQGEPGITITLDETARTLTIDDNGVGMTRDEVVQNLGTIAKSGTLEFLKANAEAAKKKEDGSALQLIGQFGVGFYAAFMVASRVDVHTRSMLPGAEPVLWRSSGAGTFSLSTGDREHPGTRIVLHLKEDAAEYTKPWRIKDIIRKYSDFVHFPIKLGDEIANRSKALWTLPKSQVTEEQHAELYHHVTSGFLGEKPLHHVHIAIDAPVQFYALLYIPEKAPPDMFQKDRQGIRLYAKRVLIMEDCDKLAPLYLRFLRGVVDSEDLSLNVSREILQENRTLSQIEQQITRQVLKSLKELAESDPEKYQAFWKEFGKVLKEGVTIDWKNKDQIAELCRFESLKTEAGKVISLRQYIEAMPEGQKEIYYITGLGRAAVERSPHLEAFRKRGYDVLFLTEPVDEWVVKSMDEFDKHRLKSVTHGDVDLGEEAEDEKKKDEAEAIESALKAVKEALGDRVKEVRASRRLTDSASCLVSAEGDPGANFERILKMMDQAPGALKESKRILELNPAHPIVKNLSKVAEREPSSERVKQWAELLHDQALLAEGVVEDPAKLVAKIQDLLTQVSSAAVTP
ncbi:molecular chaperone HtpG [Chondromyces crocatus]|uniref:Chaperone protein HtpG n=1 Tax=Chondromyces crocatus TaxID=52 RepID=A0A0K1EU52_CHOCO|nr:molecular chaperone HtpG [Chondromyces crocatus]AKT44177.1 heat-shock protein Hsp90 [Chondromyces crocatus]